MTKSVFPGGLFGDSLKAISRYLFKRLKLYLRWLNSKNNGPVLLLKTILRHLNCFLLSVAMDDKDGLGLKLEKTLGQLFQVLMSCLQKSPHKEFLWSVLLGKICLISYSKLNRGIFCRGKETHHYSTHFSCIGIYTVGAFLKPPCSNTFGLTLLQKYSERAIHTVIYIMLRRGELEHRFQRKVLYRVKWSDHGLFEFCCNYNPSWRELHRQKLIWLE